jgi:hypothetical protein
MLFLDEGSVPVEEDGAMLVQSPAFICRNGAKVEGRKAANWGREMAKKDVDTAGGVV